MNESWLASDWIGFVIIGLSGMMNASFALPMKFGKTWRWENFWLVFSALSLLILPLGFAAGFAGLPAHGLQEAAPRVLMPALVCGFVWGWAQVAFGIGISLVGIAMAFAIVGGLAGALGSLLPLAILHPRELVGRRGELLLLSILILAAGLWAYVVAARRRDRSQAGALYEGSVLRKGIAVCVFTGVAGAALNLGFALSAPLWLSLTAKGASPLGATLWVWVVLLAAGAVPNLGYSALLLSRNGTWAGFSSGGRDAGLAVAMAFLWITGTLGYGTGATIAGHAGNSVGYALYMTVLLLWSTCLGVFTGEWRQSPDTAKRFMVFAVVLIVCSVVILGMSAAA